MIISSVISGKNVKKTISIYFTSVLIILRIKRFFPHKSAFPRCLHVTFFLTSHTVMPDSSSAYLGEVFLESTKGERYTLGWLNNDYVRRMAANVVYDSRGQYSS